MTSKTKSNYTFLKKIRRGFCLQDLINAFKDEEVVGLPIGIKMKLPDGTPEQGEGSGIFKDCLSEFWADFYEKRTLGYTAKVPLIRYDYREEEWRAVGRIFLRGFQECGYIPIHLAMPFLEEVLYGKARSSLTDAFFHYVSASEKEILEDALRDFDKVDQDDLHDVVGSYGSRQLPRKDTLQALLCNLGHRELIQAPNFVIKMWRPILKSVGMSLPPEALKQKVRQLHPTCREVCKRLVVPQVLSDEERCVSKYLTKYIKELNSKELADFLRFCTGLNILLENINVTFIKMGDFERRPIGRTCGNESEVK